MSKQNRSSWGSKRERSHNTWQLRYTVAGEPQSETFHGTAKQADKRLAELQIKYDGAISNMTLSQFYETNYREYMESELAPKTVESYAARWRNYVEPRFGDTALTSITSAAIQDWILTLPYAKAKHAKVVLSSVLSYAAALGHVSENVALRKFRWPHKDTSTTRTKEVFTHDELDEIADACVGEVWEGAFLFAAFGGGQRSEVCGIKLEEIEDVDGWAMAPVRRSVHYVSGEIIIKDSAKNKYREEFILVAPPHAERVLELRDEMLSDGCVWLCDDGFGNPLNPSNMTKAYSRWFQARPLTYIPFLNLRPSYATWMRDEGFTIDEVSRLLRHSSQQMLKKVYDRPRATEMVRGLMDNSGQNSRMSRTSKKKGQTK